MSGESKSWLGKPALFEPVYAYAKNTFGALIAPTEIRRRLGRDFPSYQLFEVVACFEDACALIDAAGQAAARVRLGMLEQDQAVAFLKASFPGFTNEIYLDAYDAAFLRNDVTH